ncbi:MAG: sigma 54-interacting transcriptional regulator [Bacteroidota bacterium]
MSSSPWSTLSPLLATIAAVSNRTALLEIIETELHPMFGIDNSGILIVNKDENHYLNLAVETSEFHSSNSSESYGFVSDYYPYQGSALASMIIELEEAGQPRLFDLTKVRNTFPHDPLWNNLLDTSHDSLAAPLKVQGKVIGLFYADSEEKDCLANVNRSMFQTVADQLAVALSKVLANEHSVDEKNQKELLLSLSGDIAKIRNKSDLFQTLFEQLRPLFRFDDAVIMIKHDEESFFMVDSDNTAPTLANENYTYFLQPSIPIRGTAYEKVFAFDQPTRSKLADWLEEYPDFPGMKLMADLNYQEHLMLPLWIGDAKIGTLEFHATEEGRFSHLSQELLKGVSDQLAIAVTNVLANQQLIEEKQFKETLLEISEMATNIRNREDLYQVVMQKLKPLMQFDDAVLGLVSPDGTTHRHISAHHPSPAEGHPDYQRMLTEDIPVAGSPFEEFIAGGKVTLYETESLLKRYPHHPGLLMMRDLGEEHSILLLLHEGATVYGTLFFHYFEKPDFNAYLKELYANIADQMAVAVSNVLANERLIEEKQFKETLLEISESLATVNDRQSLYPIVVDRLRKFIPFDDAVVIVYDESYENYVHVLASSPLSRQQHPSYDQLVRLPSPITGPFVDILQSDDVAVFHLADWLERYSDHPGIQMHCDEGLEHTVKVSLKDAGKLIGAMLFHFRESQFVEPINTKLYENIAYQMSVTVNSILANEQLIEEKQFKETLLEISEAATNIRNREDLYEAVMEKLRPIVHFDDAVCIVVNEDKTYYNHILTMSPEERKNHPLFYEVVNQLLPVKDSPVEEMLNDNELSHYHLQDWLLRFPDHPGLVLMKETGLVDSVTVKLKTGGEVFGLLLFHFEAIQQLTEAQQKLYLNIADQMAVAVSNVLANEQMLAEKEFKETLLEISEAATQIRNQEQLYQTIMDKIRPIVHFDDAVLIVFSEDLTLHNHLLTVSTRERAEHPFYQKIVGKFVEVEDTPIDDMVNGDIFQLHDVELDLKKYPKHKGLNLMRDTGLHYSVITQMFNGNQLFGLLLFHFASQKVRDATPREMYLNINNEISVALSNVLANESLMEEKNKTESLLRITEAAANISNLDELHQRFLSIIKPLIAYDDTVVIIYDDDFTYGTHILTDSSPERKKHRFYEKIVDRPVQVKETSLQDFITEEQILFFDVRKDWLPKYPDFPGLILKLETDLFYTIALRLSSGGKQYGSLLFHFQEKPTLDQTKAELLNTIASQFSIAISDILNQENLVKEKEFKETLLEISEVATQIRDREGLYQTVMQKLQPLVKFDDATCIVLSEDGKYYNHILTVAPPHRKEHPMYDKVVNHPRPLTENKAVAGLFAQEEIQHHHLADLLENYPSYPELILMKETGIVDSIILKLRKSGEIFGVLAFHFNCEQSPLTEGQHRLYLNIADQLAVAVSNVLANERLLEEKQYKEILLSISEAATRIRDRKDFYKTFMEKVYPIIPYDDAVVVLLSEDRSCSKHVLTMSSRERMDHPLCQQIVNNFTPIANSPFEDFLVQADLAQYHLEDWLKEYPEHIGVRLMRDIDLIDSIVLKLRSGGEIFGFLLFHFKEIQTFSEQQKPLYLSIADQLAVAVKNVLANEEIIEREREKAELLQISEIVSTIRDRDDLTQFLSGPIKSLFRYKNASISVHGEKPNTVKVLCSDASEAIQQLPSYQKLMRAEYHLIPLNRRIMNHPEVYTYFLEDLKKGYGNLAGVQMLDHIGINATVATSLALGGEVFGFLEFHFANPDDLDQVNHNLFKNVANQVAVAVSNILANESIQAREQEKALQIDIIDAINQGRNWREKLLMASKRLQAHIPFSMIGFKPSKYTEPSPKYGFERIGPDEYRELDLDFFLTVGKIDVNMFATSLSRKTYHQITIHDTDTLYQISQESAIEKVFWENFGIRSLILLPIPLKEGYLYVVFFSRQKNFYNNSHRQLLANIQSSLGLAIEKHLNYEKISELNTRLSQEKTYLEEEIQTHYNFGQIVGESEALQEIFTQINQVADTDSTVLLLGETGTGKELVARALHQRSPRSKQSLIKINCAALPSQLIESELFGHEKGAFTGAVQRRIGKFELADASTLFLDEIGELPLELQGKLLRVLQEKEFERLGSNKVRRTDVRVVAATNRNLEEEVREGRFRSDLYFRLNVFPINLPPLRERGEDIKMLAQFFLQRYNTKFKKRLPPLQDVQLRQLERYPWPGNVRELEHLIERAVIQSSGQIDNLKLPELDPEATADSSKIIPSGEFVPKSWKDTEVEVLINTLQYCNGKVRGEGGAAQLLGLHPNTLESRMKKLGIKRQHVIHRDKL